MLVALYRCRKCRVGWGERLCTMRVRAMTERILCSRRIPGTRVPAAESGITYMELMGVCVGIGLPTAPRTGVSHRAARPHAAAPQFATAHDMARAAASRYGRVAELHIDPTNGLYYVAVDTTLNGTGTKDTVGIVHRLPAGDMTMTSTRTLVCFDRRGLASTPRSCPAGGATGTFVSGGKADTVTTSSLGRILR